jgi:phospholipid transport system substrate-binding protein
MTSLTAGPELDKATPDQQKQLTIEFSALLVHTYSGAISQVKDQKITFKPMHGDLAGGDVEVSSEVVKPRGEPIQLSYRLERVTDGWKIYDINIMGAWLVQTYKSSFVSEISKGRVEGLIKTLADKNKQREGSKAN